MRTDDERVADILEAADLISSAVELGRTRFDEDHFVQSAVLRWIQIIGEASSRLSPEFRAARPQVSWRGAAAMRNRTVHGYFDIDLDAPSLDRLGAGHRLRTALTQPVDRSSLGGQRVAAPARDPLNHSSRAGWRPTSPHVPPAVERSRARASATASVPVRPLPRAAAAANRGPSGPSSSAASRAGFSGDGLPAATRQ